MERIQDDVKARKLFDEDEDAMVEINGEREENNEDGDEEKERTFGLDDEKEKREKRRGAKDKRQDFAGEGEKKDRDRHFEGEADDQGTQAIRRNEEVHGNAGG